MGFVKPKRQYIIDRGAYRSGKRLKLSTKCRQLEKPKWKLPKKVPFWLALNVKRAPTMKAGNDLFMPGCDADLENILRALKSGALARKELARNASRVYHSKCKRNNERNRR